MALQSNLGTKPRTSSINPKDAQEWLDDNPQNKAENLTGKMHHTAIALNSGYEGAVLDREAKKIRDEKARQELIEARAKTVPIKRQRKATMSTSNYHDAVNILRKQLQAGRLITLEDIKSGHSRQSIMKMISLLRDKKIDVLTIRRGNSLVGWMLNDTVQAHRELI